MCPTASDANFMTIVTGETRAVAGINLCYVGDSCGMVAQLVKSVVKEGSFNSFDAGLPLGTELGYIINSYS